MKLNEIYKIADEYAPKALSDSFCSTYNAYDNSGVLVDAGEEIQGVLFSLDLSLRAIALAKGKGCNLIVTHHPAIYSKIGRLCADDHGTGEKIVECLKNRISVISMHLNLDGAIGGTDESLKEGIQKAASGRGMVETNGKTEILFAMQAKEMDGGYGRVYDVAETKLKTLFENVGKEFSTKRMTLYGEEDRKIRRVASFCGAGGDEGAVEFALKKGADVIVSSDFKHHVLASATERGLAVIALTHYASEHYGFKKYYEKIRCRVGIPCVLFTDETLI